MLVFKITILLYQILNLYLSYQISRYSKNESQIIQIFLSNSSHKNDGLLLLLLLLLIKNNRPFLHSGLYKKECNILSTTNFKNGQNSK
jgi:hypothetical protein